MSSGVVVSPFGVFALRVHRCVPKQQAVPRCFPRRTVVCASADFPPGGTSLGGTSTSSLGGSSSVWAQASPGTALVEAETLPELAYSPDVAAASWKAWERVFASVTEQEGILDVLQVRPRIREGGGI